MDVYDESRAYHRADPPGKLAIATTKATNSQRDLSLAYSPGVAAPCLDIAEDPEMVFDYTAKGNLVGVVSDGTAVLGLGDIGPGAFDIELDIDDTDAFIEAVAAMEPTFGGINLEDISAPACFAIEDALRERMDIPVFHDDQHGTAIITGAALLNAVELVEKDLDELQIVFSGAGASAIASARFYVSLGARRENITMVDSSGVITTDREELSELKAEFARDVDASTLAEALVDADVFVGLSVGGIVTPEMVASMASNPIIFAMANPDPEIDYATAKTAREDTVIMATGRSDDPNQVNNVLGFPFIFRGALDVRATEINEAMKRAAARALAELARRDVPDAVLKAYGDDRLQFGPEYLIPKPVDPRVLFTVAPAVAQAAMDSGAARMQIDVGAYREELEARLGKTRELMRVMINKAKRDPKRVALAEGDDPKIIRAAYQLADEQIAEPILIGAAARIEAEMDRLGLAFDVEIVDPADGYHDAYADRLYALRGRKGVTEREAVELVRSDPNYFASVMVEQGDADAMLTGLTHHYPTALRPPLQVIGTADDAAYVAGVYLLTIGGRVVFAADTTVNFEPDAAVLAEVTKHTAALARSFNIEPRAALLSYSNFGSVENARTAEIRAAVGRLHADDEVDFPVDGEMQADTAVVEEILSGTYPFAQLQRPANVLVFPSLEAGNIGYKLLQRLGGAEAIGPMLVGMDRPVHVLQRGDEVRDIVNLAAIAVTDAQDA
jgi:malate dehydrogenase (oxaloacetate-decarboxylating)(NADP+)